MRCALHLILLVLISADASAHDLSASQYSKDKQPTRIEVDADAHTIPFFVKGKPAAILDETGLHVRDDINSGGSVMDYGADAFERHVSPIAEDREHLRRLAALLPVLSMALVVAAPLRSLAQETQPGDACSVAGHFRTTGGAPTVQAASFPYAASTICVDPASGTETEIESPGVRAPAACPPGTVEFLLYGGIKRAPGAAPVPLPAERQQEQQQTAAGHDDMDQ